MNKNLSIRTKQILDITIAATGIKPLQEVPLTRDFYNGVPYVADDGKTYKSFYPIVTGEISDDPNIEDGTYLDDKTFEAYALAAYDAIDAYTNGGISTLGVFQPVPNFSNIPVFCKHQLLIAMAKAVSQMIWTNPFGAEVRVTTSQTSGGRVFNMPGRENFNPKDLLNEDVQEAVNISGIFAILEDSANVIAFDLNDYPTWEQIQAILETENYPIEKLTTDDVENWEPVNPQDGVNKKYVDIQDADLQGQINALVVGDVELHTNHVKLVNQELESYTGYETHQRGVNVENKVLITQLKEQVRNLDRRTGVPLQAYKTTIQTVEGLDYITINDYDLTGAGTVDSLGTFDNETGIYTISNKSEGDKVQFSANFKVSGKPTSNIAGYATIQVNGETVLHPVTGLSIEIPLMVSTTAGNVYSIVVNDINVRDGVVNNDWKSGDEISLVVKQSDAGIAGGYPLKISDVSFDMANLRVLSEDKELGVTETSELKITNPLLESFDGLTDNQADFNKQVVEMIESLKLKVGTTIMVETLGEIPTYGEWELVGSLEDGQTIIGGTDSLGENQYENVKYYSTNVEQDEIVEVVQELFDVGSPAVSGRQVVQSKRLTDFEPGDPELEEYIHVGTFGQDKNKAWGLGMGTLHFYKRIS